MKPFLQLVNLFKSGTDMLENACVICLCKPLSFLHYHQEKEDQQKERRFSSAQCSSGFDSSQFQTYDYEVATTSTEKSLFRKKHTDSIQNHSHMLSLLCPSHCSPHSCKCQGTSAASTQPSVTLDQEHCDTDPTDMGKAMGKKEV